MAEITLPLSENLPAPNQVAFQITVNSVSKPPAPVVTTTAQTGLGEGQTQVTLAQAAISGATDLGMGVWGNALLGCGVVGISSGNFVVAGAVGGGVAAGVYGQSTTGYGVWGLSSSVAGVYGQSTGFDAIAGETQSDAHAGVTGRNLTAGANGGVGIYGTGGKYAGKFDGALQVNGPATITGNSEFAGDCLFEKSVEVNGSLGCRGGCGFVTVNVETVTVTGDVVLMNQDCAEDFDLAPAAEFERGTVMVLEDCGLLQASWLPYDRKVAGVISGAGEFKPGLILGRDGARENGQRAPVALVGKVFCKVDTRNAAIEVGDLLTTSATKGHAMRAEDPIRAFGAVIGKALQSMPAGRKGLIPILVALQ